MKGFFAKLKDFSPKLKVSKILLFSMLQNRWKKAWIFKSKKLSERTSSLPLVDWLAGLHRTPASEKDDQAGTRAIDRVHRRRHFIRRQWGPRLCGWDGGLSIGFRSFCRYLSIKYCESDGFTGWNSLLTFVLSDYERTNSFWFLLGKNIHSGRQIFKKNPLNRGFPLYRYPSNRASIVTNSTVVITEWK